MTLGATYGLFTLFTMNIVHAQSLEDYQWKNRILILMDATLKSNSLQAQLKEFTGQNEGLTERDLILFLITEDKVYSQHGKALDMNSESVREQLGISDDFKGVLLLGKDGGIKLKEHFQVASKTVFDLIDGMPMRKAEMRKEGE